MRFNVLYLLTILSHSRTEIQISFFSIYTCVLLKTSTKNDSCLFYLHKEFILTLTFNFKKKIKPNSLIHGDSTID